MHLYIYILSLCNFLQRKSRPLKGLTIEATPILMRMSAPSLAPVLLNNVIPINRAFRFDVDTLTRICFDVQMKHIGPAVACAVNLLQGEDKIQFGGEN